MTRYRSSAKITVTAKPKTKPPLTWWQKMINAIFGRNIYG